MTDARPGGTFPLEAPAPGAATALERQLSRIARVAADLFGAPVAMVSYVDEHGRTHVEGVGLASSATAREVSCHRAPAEDMIVISGADDPRLAELQVAAEAGIRFYAGAALKASDGRNIGTLCVMDTEVRPRPEPRSLRMLSELAAVVTDELEHRRRADDQWVVGARHAHLAAVVDSTDDAILSKSLDGIILSWNAGAEKLYGYTTDEIVGKPISLLAPPDRSDEVTGILERIRAGEPVYHLETLRVAKDGTVVPVSLTISPVRDADGHVVAASTIARDISERRRLERELEAARDQAMAATELKSEFLANMSHEIRTPMNGVIGMTGLLLGTELDREQREYVETIRSSGEALLTIINDILDFSKIEAGRLDLEVIDFDLRNVVEGVANVLAERAHAKHLELATIVHPAVPTAVRGDPGRLRQVLTNLLGNAVKFTEAGEIVVRASAAHETAHEVVVRIEVTDTGIGIPPAVQAALFEPFSQADSSTARTHGGTGLGLAISKQLVELMGGRLGLSSEPGQGTTFFFTVRLAKQPDQLPAEPIARSDLKGLRVLVVDDNDTNRKILVHQVSSWGTRSGAAEDGWAALEMLRGAAAAGEAYDVALLDMEMPGMDGLALARAIRGDRELASTRLMLLTSTGVRGAGAAAREAGVCAYLTKPVGQSQLFDAVATVMGAGSVAEGLVTRHTLSEIGARSRPRLLVAEDNPVNQKVAVALLTKIGYRADVVTNGAEAVEAAFRGRYGAILMDGQMPGMDGYAATAEIRRREQGRTHLPIIAMTASAMKGERERCLAAGMDDYVSKPVDIRELQAALRRWMTPEGDGDEP